MSSVCAARTERVVACPLCGGRRMVPLCSGRDRLYHLSDRSFTYVRCESCDLLFQSVRPVEDDVAAFYPAHYGPYQAGPVAVRSDAGSPLLGPHRPLHARFRRRVREAVLRAVGTLNAALTRRFPDPLPGVLDVVYTPQRRGQLLLDFGCGSASFLDQARARGWDTLGVDFVSDVVEGVRQAGHRALLLSDAMWDALPDCSVDLVRMNHVLEHLYAPGATLTRLRRKLRPGGRLHLATPNAACLTFRLLRSRWFSLDCPRHVMLFSPRTVRPLLAQAGFARVACYQEVLTKDMARSLGYVLQDLGRLDDAGVWGMMSQPDVNRLLFAPARLAALAGASDRFHAVAE